MFHDNKEKGYFVSSVMSLFLSVLLQLFVVYHQNKQLGWRRILRESLPVVIGFKPAVDAYRVAAGVKQDVELMFSPLVELTIIKCIEMFAEAIPSLIIQLMALLWSTTTKEGVSTAALISLIASAITTGYTSATVSYDYDTNPNARRLDPEFFGYVPSNAKIRTLVFVSLVVSGTCMLFLRCISIVLLRLVGMRWALGFVSGEFCAPRII